MKGRTIAVGRIRQETDAVEKLSNVPILYARRLDVELRGVGAAKESSKPERSRSQVADWQSQ